MPDMRSSIPILNRYSGSGSYSSPKVEGPTIGTKAASSNSKIPRATVTSNQVTTTEYEQPSVGDDSESVKSKFSIPTLQKTNISQALAPSLLPESGPPTSDEDLFLDKPNTTSKASITTTGGKKGIGSSLSTTLSNASNRLPKLKRRRTDRTTSSSSSVGNISTGDKVRAKLHDFVENPVHHHRNHQDKPRIRQENRQFGRGRSTAIDRENVVGAGYGTEVGDSTACETSPSTSGHIGEMSSMQKMRAGFLHPRRKLQDKVTRSAAEEITTHLPEHPISQENDEEFLAEWETLCELMKQQDTVGRDAHTGKFLKDQILKMRELERMRNDIKVKWTLRRHAKYFHVSELQKFNKMPDIRDFNNMDDNAIKKTDFGRWLGYLMLYFSGDVVGRYIEPWDQLPAITPSRLQSIIERLTAATGPWQDWAINLQSIYRWENPKRTGKWLLAYLFFLFTNHMAVFFLGYIILQTLRNRYRPSPDSLRVSLERSRNQGMSAHRMKELMQQHPNGEWIYPLFDALGPEIQLQLLDIATVLETIQNFWEWKSPRYTAQTLSWMILALFASYFVPVETMLRLTYLGVGFIFFVCFPIASRYPKYRLVVSPLRWIFWGIPDNVGWALASLHAAAGSPDPTPTPTVPDCEVGEDGPTTLIPPTTRLPDKEPHNNLPHKALKIPCKAAHTSEPLQLVLTQTHLKLYPESSTSSLLAKSHLLSDVSAITKSRPEKTRFSWIVPVDEGRKGKGVLELAFFDGERWGLQLRGEGEGAKLEGKPKEQKVEDREEETVRWIVGGSGWGWNGCV